MASKEGPSMDASGPSFMSEANAAWVQAIGSVLAILVSILLVRFSHHLELKEERRRTDEKSKRERRNILELVAHVFGDINSLCDDPDDVHKLASNWRTKYNDDVNIPIAILNFNISQISMLPPLENMFMDSILGLAYSLNVVKIALEKETKEPMDAAGRKRVSAAAWSTKKYWARPVLRLRAAERDFPVAGTT